MKMPKLKQFEPIEVLWDDSSQPGDRVWFTKEQQKQFIDDAAYFKSIGYFLEVKHDALFLAGSFSACKNDNLISQTSKLEKIPLGCIKKITKIKL